MNVLALRPLAAARWPAPLADGRMAQVEVIEDMAAAEPHWRALEAAGSLATPYQRYDFLKLWQHHIGAPSGVKPCIVVAFNAMGAPLVLLPFGRRTIAGLKVVEFLGGKHANFNMGLWRPEAAACAEADDLHCMLGALAGHADLVKLVNQPLAWQGTTNPLALLPQQRSANYGFSGALIADYDRLLRARTNSAARKKMRKKQHALASYGTVRFEQLREPDAVRRVLDAFFKQKSARMRALGIADVFAAPHVRRFIEAAATETIPGGEPPIELYALTVGDIVVATMGGIVGGGRFCGMFNSIIKDRYAAESPGEQLLALLVHHCCARGLDTFDLGIGQAHYKSLFCNDAEPLFDTYLPLNARGRMLAFGFSATAAVKRAIKQHPALWSVARTFRRLRARISDAI